MFELGAIGGYSESQYVTQSDVLMFFRCDALAIQPEHLCSHVRLTS